MVQGERAEKEAKRDELLEEVSEIGRPGAYALHEVIRLEGDEELRRYSSRRARPASASACR